MLHSHAVHTNPHRRSVCSAICNVLDVLLSGCIAKAESASLHLSWLCVGSCRKREKRLLDESLRKVKTLGQADEDVDDLAKWVTKSRTVAEEEKELARLQVAAAALKAQEVCMHLAQHLSCPFGCFPSLCVCSQVCHIQCCGCACFVLCDGLSIVHMCTMRSYVSKTYNSCSHSITLSQHVCTPELASMCYAD